MCRFVAYLGTPILVEEILTKPNNSLIHQSFDALESEMTVNGDGFGLGYYNKEIRKEPALYRSISPAWNDKNLLYNASFIQSSCFLVHIRAATNGAVSIENTHPFHYKENLMMHNGGIPQFDKIKRDLIRLLDNEAFDWIEGQSDSQYILALFMTYLRKTRSDEIATAKEMVTCFKQTFKSIEDLKQKYGVEEPSLYNIVLSDGNRLMATRYSTDPKKETRTLYYTEKLSTYTYEGVLHVIDAHEARTATLISSEKLNHSDVWKEIPQNHAVYIDENLEVIKYSLDD